MADAKDLKSFGEQSSCGFESRLGHQFYGCVAEWSIASVLKTEVPENGTVGSNPTAPAILRKVGRAA